MVSFPGAVVQRKTVALDQSGYGLSRPCFPVAAELRIQENQPSRAAAASPSLSIPRASGRGPGSGLGPGQPRGGHTGRVLRGVLGRSSAPGSWPPRALPLEGRRAWAARHAEAREPWREKPGGKQCEQTPVPSAGDNTRAPGQCSA